MLTADCNPFAPAAIVSNGFFIAPNITSKDYKNFILSLCRNEKVSLLISLLPEELLLLESIRLKLNNIGVILVGMNTQMLECSMDKRKYSNLCESTNFHAPKYWDLHKSTEISDNHYPIIAKPTFGKGSRGVILLRNRNQLGVFLADHKKTGGGSNYILQEFLKGQEYGLDLLNSLESKPVARFLRRKIRMRDGETEIAETVNDPALETAGEALALKLAHQGIVDCDIIRSGDKDYLIDVNPRFGGGYIFSHEAGANAPAALVSWLVGREPNYIWLKPKPNVISVRYSDIKRLRIAKKKIAVITAGNSEIGMGHAKRQIAIAAISKRLGFDTIILTDSQIVFTEANRAKVEVLNVSLENKKDLLAALKLIQPDTIVVDVHEKDAPNFRELSNHWPVQLFLSRVGHDFSWYGTEIFLIGEDLHTWKTEKIEFHEGKAIGIYSGRAFLVFRDDFFMEHISSVGERECDLIIAHGGADPHHLTQQCLRALQYTNFAYQIKILIGPAFKDENTIRALARRSKHDCKIIVGETNVASHMAGAKIGLINGGNVRYELCLTGTPFVALSFQKQQYSCTEQLKKLGVGVNLGIYSEVEDKVISSTIDQLIQNMCSLEEMSNRSRRLFDMRGTERVLGIIMRMNERKCNGPC